MALRVPDTPGAARATAPLPAGIATPEVPRGPRAGRTLSHSAPLALMKQSGVHESSAMARG